jgi:hypothetical protein
MNKMRSPNYPARGLGEAVELARKFWEKEKRSEVPTESVAKTMGYNSFCGAAQVALAAMRKYGLVENYRGRIRLSDSAMHILQQRGDERLRELRKAALRPDLFRQVYDSHRGASPEALESHLVTALSFSEGGAKAFVRSFRETLIVAELDEVGHGEQHVPSDSATGISAVTPSGVRKAAADHVFTWPLSKGITVQVTFTGGDELTAAHLELLRKYLDLAKGAVEGQRTSVCRCVAV